MSLTTNIKSVLELVLNEIQSRFKGGPGSGNWGHFGRPGIRGGSSSADFGGGGLGRLGLDKDSTSEERREAAARNREERKKTGEWIAQQVKVFEAREQKALDALQAEIDAEYKVGKTAWDEHIGHTEFIGMLKKQDASEETLAWWKEQSDDALARSMDSVQKQVDMQVVHMNRETGIKQAIRDQFLYVDDPCTVTANTRGMKRVQNVREGHAEFEKIVSAKTGIHDQEIGYHRIPKGARAACWGPSVDIATDSAQRTVIHELGHSFEMFDAGAHQAAFNFLQRRTQGETARSLAQLTKNSNYRPEEVAKPDRFVSPYVGKIYSYAWGGRLRATEVISMGIERMWADPVAFAKEDPEHFALAYDIAHGRYSGAQSGASW